MHKLNSKGLGHIGLIVVLLLVVGILGGTYLVQQRTQINSKAAYEIDGVPFYGMKAGDTEGDEQLEAQIEEYGDDYKKDFANGRQGGQSCTKECPEGKYCVVWEGEQHCETKHANDDGDHREDSDGQRQDTNGEHSDTDGGEHENTRGAPQDASGEHNATSSGYQNRGGGYRDDKEDKEDNDDRDGDDNGRSNWGSNSQDREGSDEAEGRRGNGRSEEARSFRQTIMQKINELRELIRSFFGSWGRGRNN